MTRARIAALSGPLTLVVGDDALAINTAAEICRLPGHRVTVIGSGGEDFAKSAIAVGANFVAGRADSSDSLERAGVGSAATIIAVSPNDQLNLHAALLARDANPRIRIVLERTGYEDLAGKRVAVIGTGASAIQVVPAIAPVVAKLSVFQRTAA